MDCKNKSEILVKNRMGEGMGEKRDRRPLSLVVEKGITQTQDRPAGAWVATLVTRAIYN
jgi:hypothetical protein